MTSPRARAIRASDVLASALLVGAFALGAVAYDSVPAEMVVHYTPPGGVYYGVETLPKAVGLFAAPVVGAVAFGVWRAVGAATGLDERSPAVRTCGRAGLLLVVASLCGVQAALVLLNVL